MITSTHKFTGYERDSETGLDYAFARYYNQRMGRFQSGDLLGGDITDPQTLNRYSYVRNNPANLIDPTGLDCEGSEGLILNCSPTGPITIIPACNTSGDICGLSSPNIPEAPPPKKPLIGPGKPPQSQARLACAADYGQNHSIAAAFGAQNNFVGNLFGGNSISGLINLGRTVFGSATPTGSSIAGSILSGSAQGLPVPSGHPGMSGAVGQLQGAGIQAAYGAVTGVGQETLELGISASGNVVSVAAPLSETALFGVGVAKLAFDAVTVGYGYIAACH